MSAALAPEHLAAALDELWSPRVIAEFDEHYVKVAKVHGTLGWHAHADEDELFFVLKGQFRIETEAQAIDLGPGQMYVVPKGLRHNPVAMEECLIMLIERKSTLHTGAEQTEMTRTLEQQLRPV